MILFCVGSFVVVGNGLLFFGVADGRVFLPLLRFHPAELLETQNTFYKEYGCSTKQRLPFG